MPQTLFPRYTWRFALVVLASSLSLAAQESKPWVALNPATQKLDYAHTPAGDRIPDFSSAGYRGGGVALPNVPGVKTVSPSGQDDTAAIQQAIDAVSKLPLKDGHRGAVVLGKGTFHCADTLTISTSGVVLRGAGADDHGTGDNATTIELTGKPHLGLRIGGKLEQQMGKQTLVTDEYVPGGATTFHVKDATGLRVGDTLLITKPITPEWVHLMGMDQLGNRGGKPEHWISGNLDVRRRIAAVSGNTITLEVPLMDSYDAKYLGAGSVTVTKVDVTGQIAEVGVESLRISTPPRSIKLGEASFDGVRMNDTVDSWVRSAAFQETTGSVSIGRGTERITVVDVDAANRTPIVGSAKSAQFEANGSQILFDKVSGVGDNIFYMITQAEQQGPVVVLHCHFSGDGHIQPHQRWSTGLLIDNCEVPGGGIDLMNRGMMGSGHGWAIAWSVIWNSSAKSFAVHLPPGAYNWSIGNRGEEINPPQPAYDGAKPVPLHQGIIESPGKPVIPASLYLQQLKDRLGPAALKNIGY